MPSSQPFAFFRTSLCVLLSAAALVPYGGARAEPEDSGRATPSLRFADFYTQPIGPRGLEPTARLLGLAGSRVRLVGYVVHVTGSLGRPLEDVAILAPLPVSLGDEDESFADDLPPAVAYVHGLGSGTEPGRVAQACSGLVSVAGTLDVGPDSERDGRMSYVRVHAEVIRCLGHDG